MYNNFLHLPPTRVKVSRNASQFGNRSLCAMLTLRGSTRTSSSRTYVGVGNYCLDRKMLFTLVARALAPPGLMYVSEMIYIFYVCVGNDLYISCMCRKYSIYSTHTHRHTQASPPEEVQTLLTAA